MKYLKFPALILIILSILVAGYFFFLPRQISSPSYDKVSFAHSLNKTGSYEFFEIEKNDLSKMREICNSAKGSLHEFYNTPEVLIRFEQTGGKEPQFFSIFLKDGFLYSDYYLTAWYDRMRGFPSYCYVLTKEQKGFFSQLLKKFSTVQQGVSEDKQESKEPSDFKPGE